MKNGKVVVARLWSQYDGSVPSRAPIILGTNPQKYQTICVYLMKNSKKPNFFEEKGCKVFYIIRKKFFRMFNLWAIWKLSRVLKRERVDILHCHRYKSTVYGTIAATLAGTQVVVSHVHGISRTRNLKRKLTNFFILKKVNKIVTVGEAVREDVLKTNPFVQPDKVVSIGNSIDYDQFANVQITKQRAKENIGLKADSFVFGTVGRLAPTKGQTYLIRVFEKVKEALPLAQLILIGDGRLRNKLEQQVAEAPYGDSIHFLGRRDNIPELLRAMDAFVFPSIAEGLPRALLEAMAAGVPCIGAAAGGIPEILANGKFGYLVPPKNVTALAETMISLARKPDPHRQLLAQIAKQRVIDEYSHGVISTRLENIYLSEITAKLSFAEYLKYSIDLIELENRYLPIEELHVQYNPSRFEKYKSLHEGPLETVLDMDVSPHCRLLRAYEEDKTRFWSIVKKTAYYKMQRLYGKSNKSAISKIKRLIKLYEDIKSNGLNSNIIVVNRPIIENRFNHTYEIFTGHHRVACCILLDIKSVPSKIVEVRSK